MIRGGFGRGRGIFHAFLPNLLHLLGNDLWELGFRLNNQIRHELNGKFS